MDNFTYTALGGVYDSSGSANLAIAINGTGVWSGPVTSDSQPISPQSALTELCTWTSGTQLSGTVTLEITTDADQIFFSLLGQEITGNAGVMSMQLEYPDPAINSHAVNNVRINGVSQPTPVNTNKPETPGDIRGWHYRFDGGAVFACDYYTGPF